MDVDVVYDVPIPYKLPGRTKEDEGGAVLLLDPRSEDPRHHQVDRLRVREAGYVLRSAIVTPRCSAI